MGPGVSLSRPFPQHNTTMTKHYYKRLAARNTISVGGKNIPFVLMVNGDGIIETDKPDIQAALDLRIEERRGGVGLITAEQYAKFFQEDDAAKKGASAKPLPKPSGPRASVNPQEVNPVVAAVAPSSRRVFRKVVTSAVDATPTAPPAPPATAPTPETGAP